MTIRSANLPFVMDPEPRTCSDRQVKAIKGQSILAVGLRRFRTLSGVSHKRPHQQRPPLPPMAPVFSSERTLLPLAPVTVAEQKQDSASSSAKPCNSTRFTDASDSGPFPPCVSHLQGIHFVRDANQDPDLDADESTLSWPQSAHSEKSSTISVTEDVINRLSGHSHSFSMTWSEQCASTSPISVTPSEDSSSMSDSSLTSQIMEKIPPKLLSVRACNMASPPIDCESPYAPYAPTSPLSACNNLDSQLSAHNIPAIPFNIRSALRGTLPSKVPKATAKTTTLHQRQATQDLQVTCESSGMEFYPSSSSHKVCSPKILHTVDSTPLGASGRQNLLDQCNSPNPGYLPRISCSVASVPKAVKTEKLRLPGNFDHHRGHSTSPGALSSIPFPGSDHDEEVPESTRERTRSQSSISHFRNHLNNFWSLPINRLRTSSSLSTVMRGIRPGKRRNPSDVSFEARPSSMRTEDSYEILDSSAIPPVK